MKEYQCGSCPPILQKKCPESIDTTAKPLCDRPHPSLRAVDIHDTNANEQIADLGQEARALDGWAEYHMGLQADVDAGMYTKEQANKILEDHAKNQDM